MKNSLQAKTPCLLCGKLTTMSFEHIPPKCAFNNKGIMVQGVEHFAHEESRVFGKMKRSPRGFGKSTICNSCNNNSGNWYVKDFCKFTEQGLNILRKNKDPRGVRGIYTIKPKNGLKQIMMMFLAADSSGGVGRLPGLAYYLLNRDSDKFPEGINIYIYSNASSKKKRMMGYCIVGDLATNTIYKWSEINFQPFGYFFTYDSPPPNDFMVNITPFSKVTHDHEIQLTLTIAYLIVEDWIIGQYKNV